MAAIRMRDPSGKVWELDDSEQKDALKNGYSPVVQVAAHHRGVPGGAQAAVAAPVAAPAAPVDQSAQSQPDAVPDQTTAPQWQEPGITAALPTVGGITGGLLGGAGGTAFGLGVGGAPGAAGGAALGGAGGEALRQIILQAMGHGPQTSGEAAKNIGIQGGIQGASDLVGQGVGKAAMGTGKALMGSALKFAPDVVKTAIDEGITATKGGVQKLMSKLGEQGDRAMAMLRRSTAAGTRFHPMEVLSGAEQSLADNLAGNRTPAAFEDLNTFKKLSSQFLQRNQGEMTPIQLQELKTDAQAFADPIYKKIALKEPVDAKDLAKARWYKAVADHAKDLLEKTTPDAIDPATGKAVSLAEHNARTANLIKLKQVMVPDVKGDQGLAARIAQHAASPISRTIAGAGTGAAVGAGADTHNRAAGALMGGIAGAAVGSPQASSTLALLARNPRLLAALQAAPHLLGGALQPQAQP